MEKASESLGIAGSSPVVVSVPHAGRDYAPVLQAMLSVPVDRLRSLEDAYADRLAADAARAGHVVVIARTPRLVIDLNRAEDDFDPAWISGASLGGPMSARVRSGLGLVPTRIAGVPAIWRGPLPRDELTRRIAVAHRPFHASVADALAAARRAHRTAVLIDLHSMPSLSLADIVIGDRHGASASPWVTEAAVAVFMEQGLRVAVNRPYAGAHILARHGRPACDVHAVQVEIDRRLYLDTNQCSPGSGMAAMTAAVGRLADRLAEAIGGHRLAAE